MGSVDAPRCANQIHVRGERGAVEGGPICSCAAGLIHMHDCPVTAGLDCTHFRPLGDDPPALDLKEAEDLRERLMQDYLSRPYYHRVRSLAPAGNPWARRKEELYAFYSNVELGKDQGRSIEAEDESYERDRDRLIEQRKKREAVRAEREERTREERATERARLGIKTVVEKAQEAVAAQGNVASSFLDEVKLPPGEKKPRRRRGRRKGPSKATGDKPAGPPKPRAEATGEPKKRKRRRRRRRSGGGGPGGGGGGGGAPPA